MISASMIVKNEEKCLEQCLSSIKGIDEIVILDTGSTDATAKIAEKYTDKVFVGEYEWCDDFAGARNESLKRCSGDWIFIIDADEKLETGVGSLVNAVKNANGQDVLMAKVVSGGTAFWSARLFKNNGIRWKGAVHNHLTKTGSKKTGVVVNCGWSENHGRDPDRAFRILLKEVKRDPALVREKYYLAREYCYRGDWLQAVFWFKEYLAVAHWAPEWADAWYLLARCYVSLKRFDDAKSACLEALKINADFREPMLLMAELCGPKNRKKWRLFAEQSKNEDVLFEREFTFGGISA